MPETSSGTKGDVPPVLTTLVEGKPLPGYKENQVVAFNALINNAKALIRCYQQERITGGITTVGDLLSKMIQMNIVGQKKGPEAFKLLGLKNEDPLEKAFVLGEPIGAASSESTVSVKTPLETVTSKEVLPPLPSWESVSWATQSENEELKNKLIQLQAELEKEKLKSSTIVEPSTSKASEVSEPAKPKVKPLVDQDVAFWASQFQMNVETFTETLSKSLDWSTVGDRKLSSLNQAELEKLITEISVFKTSTWEPADRLPSNLIEVLPLLGDLLVEIAGICGTKLAYGNEKLVLNAGAIFTTDSAARQSLIGNLQPKAREAASKAVAYYAAMVDVFKHPPGKEIMGQRESPLYPVRVYALYIIFSEVFRQVYKVDLSDQQKIWAVNGHAQSDIIKVLAPYMETLPNVTLTTKVVGCWESLLRQHVKRILVDPTEGKRLLARVELTNKCLRVSNNVLYHNLLGRRTQAFRDRTKKDAKLEMRQIDDTPNINRAQKKPVMTGEEYIAIEKLNSAIDNSKEEILSSFDKELGPEKWLEFNRSTVSRVKSLFKTVSVELDRRHDQVRSQMKEKRAKLANQQKGSKEVDDNTNYLSVAAEIMEYKSADYEKKMDIIIQKLFNKNDLSVRELMIKTPKEVKNLFVELLGKGHKPGGQCECVHRCTELTFRNPFRFFPDEDSTVGSDG